MEKMEKILNVLDLEGVCRELENEGADWEWVGIDRNDSIYAYKGKPLYDSICFFAVSEDDSADQIYVGDLSDFVNSENSYDDVYRELCSDWDGGIAERYWLVTRSEVEEVLGKNTETVENTKLQPQSETIQLLGEQILREGGFQTILRQVNTRVCMYFVVEKQKSDGWSVSISVLKIIELILGKDNKTIEGIVLSDGSVLKGSDCKGVFVTKNEALEYAIKLTQEQKETT